MEPSAQTTPSSTTPIPSAAQREVSQPMKAPAAAPAYKPTKAPSAPHAPAAMAVPVPLPTISPVQTGGRLTKERRLGVCEWIACSGTVISSPDTEYFNSASRIGLLSGPGRVTSTVVCAWTAEGMQRDSARAIGARAARQRCLVKSVASVWCSKRTCQTQARVA
jgi:hypothetical protein